MILKDISYQHLQLMLQFIYCGSVDVITEDVEDFRKALESLQIEFNQKDETGAGDDSENDDNCSATVMNDKDFQDLIDIEEPAWNNVLIKDEPIDEEHLEEPTNVERPSIKPNIKTYIRRRTVQGLPSRTSTPSSSKIIKLDGKISVDRVVPSKKLQQFMHINQEICPFCKKFFKTSKHRNEHVKYCTNNPNRVVSLCPLCNKSVCDPYYLRKHIRNVHGKVNPSGQFLNNLEIRKGIRKV